MKAKLILNPVAGGDTAQEHLALINARLRRLSGTLDIALTVGEGDATLLARQATEDGYDHLFVAGGDGTLNEVLNGVAQVEAGLERVTLGIIPFGTGNDFATALGIPSDVEGALDALVGGQPQAVDVGRLNDRHFINVSAGGFLAAASIAASERLKTITGRLAYLIGGAQVLLDYEPVRTRITIDAQREASLYAFAVCNSPLVGGGRLIAPRAALNDGWLDVCLIYDMPTVEFVALLASVAHGDHLHDDRVDYIRAREVTLEFSRTIPVNTDGQVLHADRCHYELLPGAVRFRAPRHA